MGAEANGHSLDKLRFFNILPAPGSCPWAQRTWIALEELGVKYDTTLVDKSNKSKEFTDLFVSIWPDKEKTSTVPLIIDTDGTKLAESSVTVEYLEAKYGPKLLPKDPAQAAKARLFVDVFQANIPKHAQAALAASTQSEADKALQSLTQGLQVLEKYIQLHGSAKGPFFLGSSYSLAEVLTAPFVKTQALVLPHFRKFDLVGKAKELGLDRLAAWIQAVVERPSTSATSLPDDQKLSLYAQRVTEIKG